MRIILFFLGILASSLSFAEKVTPNNSVENFVTVRDRENQGAEIARLPVGEYAELLDTRDKNYYIQLENGTIGFVQINWTALIQEPEIIEKTIPNTSAFLTETANSLDNTELMTMHFIDVGQGDSSLIICPDNTSILIDAGTKGSPNEFLLNEYLTEALGPENKIIDALIISQNNEDYFNLLPEVLRNFSVKHIFHTQLADSKDSSKLKILLDSATTKSTVFNADYYNPADVSNNDISCGNANVYVLAAGEYSIVVKIQFNDFSAILSSNANHKTEELILSRYDTDFLNIDVLKVSNHGDITSSNSFQWLNSTKPLIAVISVGKENEDGDPQDELITRLSPYTLSQTDFSHKLSIATRSINDLIWEINSEFEELIYSTADNGNVNIKSTGYDADLSFNLHDN